MPDGVTVVTGYLGDPESLPVAFEGVERMYLAPLPKTLDSTLELARQANVEYVIALSGEAHWQAHADAVAASGLVNTQLGPGEFLENFAIWAEQIKATRTVREPSPTAVEAPISMDDIARVAAALLVKPDESHFGRIYPITGPEALTRAQIAEQIGAGIGVEVTYQQCGRAEAEEHYNGPLGGQAAWYLDQIEDAVRHPQDANDLVTKLAGTPAQSVAQWAAANAELFTRSEERSSR